MFVMLLTPVKPASLENELDSMATLGARRHAVIQPGCSRDKRKRKRKRKRTRGSSHEKRTRQRAVVPLSGPFDLVDGPRAVRVLDEGAVGGVIEDDFSMGASEVDELLQLGPGGACTGGVVRVAEHDDVAVLASEAHA